VELSTLFQQCYNGGKYIGNQCSCPVGWTGTFCELPKCTNKGISPEFILNEVDMVFMVELTAQSHAQVRASFPLIAVRMSD
ncbi:hypothetical protein COOONC_20918, partial [Cooperia oncophora]